MKAKAILAQLSVARDKIIAIMLPVLLRKVDVPESWLHFSIDMSSLVTLYFTAFVGLVWLILPGFPVKYLDILLTNTFVLPQVFVPETNRL